MRVQTKATDRRSVRLPSTAVALASRPSPRQIPAGQRLRATQRGQLCDDRSHRSRRRQGPNRRSERSAQATPPFGLTFRAMNVGMRHRRGPSAGYSASLLMSVIALALACFPVLAHAEDSSGVQYSDAIPKAEGENTPTPHHQQTPAKSSSTDHGGGTTPSNSGSEGSKEAEGSGEGESSGGGVAAGKHDGGGTGQGNPGGSANGGAKNAAHSAGQKAPAATKAQSSDSGSSSPLVPILIAIAALAAISVAIVMARQRRQRRGPSTTASPEAN